jgi:hypothetical protein
MLAYPRVTPAPAGLAADEAQKFFTMQVVPRLVDVWLSDYERSAKAPDIVETTVTGFSYLFDVAAERLIAAWGVSHGRHAAARDKSRMAGHPLSAGPMYHRGHAIPHTLGGPTDINLVAQRGSINVGPFRELEKRAVATPGSLYFTYWKYANANDQKPVKVEQGLLVPGQPLVVREFVN